MNWRATLILILIAAALYAFFDLYENKQPSTREAAENATHVLTQNRDQIDGLVITNHDVKIDLRREGSQWSMKVPLADRADKTLVDEVMTDLDTMRKDETIPASEVVGNQAKLQDYGLQSPKVQLAIQVHGAAQATELLFGNDTAIEGKTYLQLGSTGDVLVVGDELKKVLEKDVNAWRDHRLTDVAATDVTKMTIKNGAGEIELQRTSDHWKIAKPLDARANDQKVNDLVAQVTNLTIQSFVADDKANGAAYGLADPRGVITLYTANDPKGSELLVGTSPVTPPEPPKASAAGSPAPEAKAPDSVYARLPARQSIYTVPKAIEEVLAVKPNDLRDRSLVRLNPDMVDRIKITPDQGAPFTVGRKDKVWSVVAPASTQTVDDAEPARLMQQLSGAQVTDFVADSAADLAKYGLDHPTLQVTFSSFASENTAESNAGDKPIATVSFGKTDGQNVFARVEEEPFVMSVPKTVLDDIPANVLAWQPLNIFTVDPEKVGVLDEKAKDRPELALARAEKGDWTLTKGTGAVDQAKVQSVVNTLARLHAVRWVGEIKPQYGLDEAGTSLSFEGTGDPKTRRTLVLGGLTPDQMGYARVDGKDGAFLVSRPDYDTLLQALVPLPAPTPAPSPAATPVPVPAATVAPAIMTPEPATPAATPQAAATPMPVATPEPTVTLTPVATPQPTATPTPMSAPTPVPTPEPTATPTPVTTPEPTVTPVATPQPPATPMSVPTPVSTPEPTVTPTPVTTPEPTVTPVATPQPPATPMSVPTPVSTPEPTATPTPTATPVSSAAP